jgi:hypothetical protein
MLCTPIREVLGSNLGRDTGYHKYGFSSFHQLLQANALSNLVFMPLPSMSSLIHQSSFHPMLYGLDTESVVKYITKKNGSSVHT